MISGYPIGDQPISAAEVSDNVSASVLSATFSQQAITVTASCVVPPAVLALTDTQPAPSISGSCVVTPAVLSVTNSQPAPTVHASCLITPAVLSMAFSQAAPVISGSSVTLAGVEVIAPSLPAPSTSAGAVVALGTLADGLSQQGPTVSASCVVVAGAALSATYSLPDVTVSAGSGAVQQWSGGGWIGWLSIDDEDVTVTVPAASMRMTLRPCSVSTTSKPARRPRPSVPSRPMPRHATATCGILAADLNYERALMDDEMLLEAML